MNNKEMMLPLVDKDLFVNILASSSCKEASMFKGVDKVLDSWAESKSKIFDFLGGKLVVEKDLKTILDDSTAENLKNKFMNDIAYNIREKLNKKDNYDYSYYDIEQITQNAQSMLSDISIQELKNNILNEDYEKFGVKKGMKLSKALSKQIDNTVIKDLFNIEFSRLVQDMYFDGVLCLSINPIDYLTMSVSNSGWTSCHKVYNGGYRAGTLAYMVDNHSMIAYVRSRDMVEHDFNDNSLTVNNKKWRQCVYLNVEAKTAIFSRQYPFFSEDICAEVRQMVEKLFDLGDVWALTKSRNKIEDYVESYEVYDEVEGDSCTLFYNDVLNYSDANYSMIYPKEQPIGQFILGGKVICPVCGEHELSNSSELICNYCNGYYQVCSHCGETVTAYDTIDGNIVCTNCIDEMYYRCYECGDWHLKEDMHEVKDGFRLRIMCDRCFEKCTIPCAECGQIIYKHGYNSYAYNDDWYCQSCYEEVQRRAESHLCEPIVINGDNSRNYIAVDGSIDMPQQANYSGYVNLIEEIARQSIWSNGYLHDDNAGIASQDIVINEGNIAQLIDEIEA